MPLTHNGVTFREMSPESPQFSLMPAGDSRLRMTGWFDWDDVVSRRASAAFLGRSQVANGYPGANPALPYLACTLPYVHADWNPDGAQFFVADSFERVQGFIPHSPSAGPRGSATFEEALTTIGLQKMGPGYRVLSDAATVDPAFGVPREYFCLRQVEIQEGVGRRDMNIPGFSGLLWQYAQDPNVPPPGGIFGFLRPFVAQNIRMDLFNGEITLKWYPLPVTGAYNEAAFLDLVGKTNSAPFPPPPPNLPGVPTVRSPLSTFPAGTLVMGQPARRIIRMGDCAFALEVTLRLRYHACGANSFFWASPPEGTRGRIHIADDGTPTSDPTLSGPGYYPVQRSDGTLLFPPARFAAAFCPPGTPAAALPAF